MLKLHEDLRIISRLQPLLGLFNFAFSPPRAFTGYCWCKSFGNPDLASAATSTPLLENDH